MWASDWTVFCPCATKRRTRIRLINHEESVGQRLVIPFASFSLHELDLAYARCLKSLPLQYMYFDFKANIFKLQIIAKIRVRVE